MCEQVIGIYLVVTCANVSYCKMSPKTPNFIVSCVRVYISYVPLQLFP